MCEEGNSISDMIGMGSVGDNSASEGDGGGCGGMRISVALTNVEDIFTRDGIDD